ncbi:MAG: glycosyltransferase family 2 protein, partial [Chlorobia bacterium]|nr:glycosyltransferase family 2 protein [Fimbriimonadaceae bacterium]
MPKFSILLPTHNRADVVGIAIQSALNQTEGDFELLIVGDGCSDGTAEVVSSFGDSRIKWFGLPKGPGFGYANRNIALREATGDLVAFLAHDDFWFPDHLERMAKHFQNPSIEFAYSRTLWARPDGMILPIVFNLQLEEHRTPFLNMEINYIAALNVVHRQTVFKEVGYWDDALPANADMDMWGRIIRHYGPASIAFESIPTALHFRANWRPVIGSGPQGIIWLNKWVQDGSRLPVG